MVNTAFLARSSGYDSPRKGEKREWTIGRPMVRSVRMRYGTCLLRDQIIILNNDTLVSWA